jgi:hypothetical protein
MAGKTGLAGVALRQAFISSQAPRRRFDLPSINSSKDN